jgi:hypothetical protein
MTTHHQRKRIGNFELCKLLADIRKAEAILNLELVGSSEISFVFVKLICLGLDIPQKVLAHFRKLVSRNFTEPSIQHSKSNNIMHSPFLEKEYQITEKTSRDL